MILAFMLVYSYGVFVCRAVKRKWVSYLNVCLPKDSEFCEDDFEIAYNGSVYWEEGEFRFAPTVYNQRYIVVQEKLEQLGPFKKVVELGCAEFGFFNYLKHLEGVEEIVLVDLNEALLTQRCNVLRPLLVDYLKPRCTPLDVKILAGNAAVPDLQLSGVNALVAIELIEHMFPPDLDELPYTVFGVLQPDIAIFTTPNSDFNHLFKLTGFRLSDHKFEWTRLQFKEWVENIVVRFPEYSSKLYGIGPGPEGTSQYGACTQMVLFQRNTSTSKYDLPSSFQENSYNVISNYTYPFEPKVEISLEEHVTYHAEKFIRYASNLDQFCSDEQIEIPFKSIMRMVTRHTDSEDLLQAVLEERGWTIEETKPGEKCVVLPITGLPSSSSSSRSGEVGQQSVESVESCCNIYDNSWENDEGSSGVPGVSQARWHKTWSDDDISVTVPSSQQNDICTNIESFTKVDYSVNGSHYDEHKDCDKVECRRSACLCDRLSCKNELSSCNNEHRDISEQLVKEINIVKKKDKTVADKVGSKLEGISLSDSLCEPKMVETDIFSSTNTGNHLAGVGNSRLPVSPIHSNDLNLSSKDLNSTPVQSICVGDSLDIQQKIETESLDIFDESHISSHSLAKDMCSVKRSLDLPLDSVKINLNGNFERNVSGTKRSVEAKVPQFPDISENQNYKGCFKPNKSACISGSLEFNTSNSCKLGKVGNSSGSLVEGSRFSLEAKRSVGSDSQDKVDVCWGLNQSGINRCLSLQHIKEKEGASKSNRFSLCCEKENINICDIFKDGLKTKSCGHSFDEVIDLIRADTTANFDDSCSQSKAVDSGYPNTSDRDMDMDLTPEQVDELLSENESSPDEREDEEERAIGGAAPIQILDHVENGDVANNNRDGEGNNLDQEDLGHPINFQQIIREEGNELPLDEVPLQQDSDSDNEEKFMSCASLITDATLVGEDSLEADRMSSCIGWLHTSTPCHSREGVWRSPEVSIMERHDLSASSTSLEVHPPTSTLSIGTIEHFPSWLLGITLDDAGDSFNNSGGEFSETHGFSSHDTIQDEDWSEAIVREDVLGGGEPHTEL